MALPCTLQCSFSRIASALIKPAPEPFCRRGTNIVEANITPARGLAITGRRLTTVFAGSQGRGGRRKRRAWYFALIMLRVHILAAGALLVPPGMRDFEVEDMTLLSMNSLMARYLLGDLPPDELRRVEEAIPLDYRLRRELETAKEELTAAYVVGRLCGKDRLKFETAFLASEEGERKIKFARAWVETGGSACLDLTSPLHRYVFGDLPLNEVIEVEKKLPSDENYRQRLEAAEGEVLSAYFHETLPGSERKLFDSHYLSSDRIVGKLRFAHIMCEYERASVAPVSGAGS